MHVGIADRVSDHAHDIIARFEIGRDLFDPGNPVDRTIARIAIGREPLVLVILPDFFDKYVTQCKQTKPQT